MSFLSIRHQQNQIRSFVAANEIGNLIVVETSPFGSNYVRVATQYSPNVIGVSYGSLSNGTQSGQRLDVVVQGVLSGVVFASGVNPGDRVAAMSGGRIVAVNTVLAGGTGSGNTRIAFGVSMGASGAAGALGTISIP